MLPFKKREKSIILIMEVNGLLKTYGFILNKLGVNKLLINVSMISKI